VALDERREFVSVLDSESGRNIHCKITRERSQTPNPRAV
jgi:hypothetical protein